MKLSLNWLNDYVAIKNYGLDKIVELITFKVAEVEVSTLVGQHLKNIIVAEVIAKKPHPNADRLSIAEIDVGDRQESVVCGATNFKAGDKVAYAGLGTILPGGLKIKPVKIRGVTSCGMLCSELELGLSDDHKGIAVLAHDLPLGTSLAEVYPDQLDGIIEIDNKSITHRPDLWGHFGIARELAAILKLPAPALKLKSDWDSDNSPPVIAIDIKEKKQVPRLVCQGVKGVQVRPSPDFIRHRLYRVGLRAINNLVDVTNYVMLDLGQPMHVFDVDKIDSKKLTIEFATAEDEFTSLYNEKLKLTDQDLVFFESGKVTALCGIIGGLGSGISDEAKRIFLEAGNWKADLVRKSATRLGLRTEAVQRYEKSIDPELTLFAIDKAWSVLALTCPGIKKLGGLFDHDQKYFTPITIKYSPALTRKLLGLEISAEKQADILSRLGFVVKQKTDYWQVAVPSWRGTKDVSIPEDLVEEVGRIYGYDKIKLQAPLFPIEKPRFNRVRLLERKVKNTLVSRGFNEVINYPLTDADSEEILNLNKEELIRILNPALSDQDRLKMSLLPHFLATIAHNQKNHANFKQFEIGKIYCQKDGKPLEIDQMVLGFSPAANASYQESFAALLLDLQAGSLAMPYGLWEFVKPASPMLLAHPNLQADILCQGEKIGQVFQVSPKYHAKYSLKSRVFLAEINFTKLYSFTSRTFKYTAASKFPPVYFDISLVVAPTVLYNDIATKILKISSDIAKVRFLDRFFLQDTAQVSLTLQLEFRSFEKTFSSTEVKALQDKIIMELEKQGIFLKK